MTQFGLQMDSTLTERSKGQKFLSEFNGNERSNSQSLSFNVCTCEEFYGSLILSLNKKDSPNRPSNVDELRLLETGVVDGSCTTSKATLSFGKNKNDYTIRSGHQIILQSTGEEISVGGSVQAKPIFEREINNTQDDIKKEIGLSFTIGPGEFFLGGPEDPRGLVKNGSVFEVYNTDALGLGGVGRYQNTPVFWSTKGYLLFVLNKEPVTIDFGSRRSSVLEISTRAEHLEILVAPSDSPQLAFSMFREVFCPARSVPDWSYGLWLSRCYYKNQVELENVLAKAEELNQKIDVINLDARAWMDPDTRTDFKWDDSRWDDFKTYIPSLNQRGMKVCLWENPYVSSHSDLYREGADLGYFAKNSEGEVYSLDWVPDGLEGFPKPPLAGLVDFTNENARAWWKDLHRPYIEAGVSAFKTDFGEEIPEDCVFSDGRSGFELRNEYSDLYNKCVLEVLTEELGEEGILWARSANLLASSHPVKWNGDSQTSYRALEGSLKGGLSQACGGAIFWSHDVGGFYGELPEPELFLRWAQFGLWTSHVRLHGTTKREPWEFGEEVYSNFNEALEIRRKLSKYFIEEGKKCVSHGQSFIRPLWLEENNHALMYIEDQFYAGSRFVVAPFLEPGAGRKIFLPQGEWTDLRNGRKITGPILIETEPTSATPVFFKDMYAASSDYEDWLRTAVDQIIES